MLIVKVSVEMISAMLQWAQTAGCSYNDPALLSPPPQPLKCICTFKCVYYCQILSCFLYSCWCWKYSGPELYLRTSEDAPGLWTGFPSQGWGPASSGGGEIKDLVHKGKMSCEIDKRLSSASTVLHSEYGTAVVKKESSRKAKLSIYWWGLSFTLTYSQEHWVG